MLPLWTLLKSRWTWYGLAAGAVLFAGLALRSHYISLGEQRGKDAQAQAGQQEIETQRKLAQAEANAKIADANARAEEANARAAGFALKAQQLTGQLLASRRAVDALPAPAVRPHIVAALGLRIPGDASPDYTPAEEREIARRVDAAPLLEQRIAALDGQVNGLSDQVKALSAGIAAREAYTERLEGWYVQLYNLHPPRKRAPKCLWLWRCKTERLPVPAPSELHK